MVLQRTGNPLADAERRLHAPIHAERHCRVLCVGAGASGLLLAYKLQRHFQNYSLTIYEKNTQISGTWFENRYPGCACDIPAHTYTWSFEPKPDWTSVYAGSKEINDYFEAFAKKYSLHQYIKTQHEVIGAYWDDQQAGYHVRVRDVATGAEHSDFCDILINASGILNHWKWPAIPGLHDYKGRLLHTANWDESIDLTGQHVGLIGNGSSGIQVLPTIQPKVSKCTTFIREPTWVSPVQGLAQHNYTPEEKQEFATKPGALLEYRKLLERSINGQFGIFLKNSQISIETTKAMRELMKEKLQNPYLEEKLIPDWSVGCRRPTPGVGYLEALGKPNVKVVYGEILKVTERGCVCDDGNEYPVDVLICATGFDTGFRPRFPILGPGGVNLQDLWEKKANSYLGIGAASIPNFLMFLGPNCPIGNGPLLPAIEVQSDYFCKLISRWQTHNIRTFTPKQAAVDDFIAHKDAFMKDTVWADPCRSWYKASAVDDTVTALWPGSTLHYLEALREPRLEDYEVEYAGNRFAWLGNGYSQTEVDETADWAYYIRERDDDPPLSLTGQVRLLNKSGTIKPGANVLPLISTTAQPNPNL